MRRRAFITLVAGAAAVWPLAARAQQSGKVFRLGYITASVPVPHFRGAFREDLRALGWIEGKNVIYEDDLYAENRLDRLPELASELVRLKVDVIVADGTLAPLAAKRATSTIPIVLTSAGDPLGSGLVTNLARPGENVTGLSLMQSDIGGKRLEMLKEAVPQASRVGILWNAANPYSAIVFKEAQSAAHILGIQLQSIEVRSPDDFDPALRALMQLNLGALITVGDPFIHSYRKSIADFAARAGLPAIYSSREFVEAGGLMAYGAHLADLNRRAAGYVDKIFKGAKPSDLPIEQPTKFELVINLKTARALGLDIPPTLLARADEVIE
jgi:putative tryptophan/tyrosine transport system substrate-binding protein